MGNFLSRLGQGLSGFGAGVKDPSFAVKAARRREEEEERRRLGEILSGQTIPAFASLEQTPEQIRQAQLQQLAALGTPEATQIIAQQSPLTADPLKQRQLQLQEQRAALDARKFDLDARKFERDLQKPGLSDKDIFDRSTKLRKEFTGLSKDFIVQRDSFARVQASADNPSAAGDLALIFNYMKILDPGSVVRESEFATAQNAAGVPERIRALYNNTLRGERLSPKTRADFVGRAEKLFSRAQGQHEKRVDQYRSLAGRVGANPEDVVLDLTLASRQANEQVAEQQSPGAQPQQGEGTIATNPSTGEKLILRGGQWQPL